FFFCERCGFSVRNFHIACHGDCFCEHPTGKRIAVDGGWHDAGDLSQGLCNTAQSVSAMLELAEHYKNQPDIYAKILSEARWGLDWVLKTTFHDGYRGVWTTIGIWTNLKQGDFDDIVFPAYNDPFENFCASACESAGYRIFLGIDVKFAKELLETAKSDFVFGMQRIDQLDCLRCFMTKRKYPQIQVYSKGIIAAVHLYHATEEEEYLHIAVRLSKVLTDSQQLEFPNWNQPVRGFFYESPQKEHILNYYHRAHSEAPIMALCLLCEVGKEYSEYTAWEQAIQLYSEYIKNCSQYTSPYCIIPAGIYDTEDFDWEDAKICGDPGVRSQEYDAQVRAGIPLDTTHYLRIFPVWHDFRGNNGVLLSLAKSASCAAKYLHDQALMQIAQNCENWILGRNPFSKSLMYGEGYSFDPLYTAFSMDMVGEIPVGIKTFENRDVPYYPFENNCTYKEIWVHSAQEYLWVLADCI
ncbi:MAG: glycoside hydrolase family 9 protein, partial [Oscillospiraceae bacterium]